MDELGKLLPRFLNKHVRGDQAPVLEVLTPLWPRVAGKAMAEQSRPVAFGNGTLTLAASSAPWATELRGLQDEIRMAVNRMLGRPLVKKVRVRQSPVSGSGSDHDIPGVFRFGAGAAKVKQEPTTLPMPGKAPHSIREENTFEIEAGLDAELREIMLRSFAKYFGRANRRVN